MNEHVNEPGTDQVERALAALRQASASSRAPDHIEAGLVQAFRAQRQKAAGEANRRRRYAWIGGAIAASLVVAMAVRLSQPVVVTAPEAPVVAKVAAVPPPVPPARTEPKPAAEPARKAARARPRVRPQRESESLNVSTPATRELTTDFFPIPYAPAMTHIDRGQLIRVNVPATSMRNFGLPVSEERMFDRVRADVLLGEDGIARAIRFVR
jgi:hypothetical protein